VQIVKFRGVRRVLSFTLLAFSLGGCAAWVRKEDARGGEVHDHFTSRNASLVASRANSSCAQRGLGTASVQLVKRGELFGDTEYDTYRFICSASRADPTVSLPTSAARRAETPSSASSPSSLTALVNSYCSSLGWNQGSPQWQRCEQSARTSIAASDVLQSSILSERAFAIDSAALGRCETAGLRRGTTEFERCSIQAHTNLRAEMAERATMQRLEAERLQAIELARADAERVRRQEQGMRMMELGLGMAAQGSNPNSRPDNSGPRTYTVNGNTYTCQTFGTATNCLPLRR
jgi:hypothetical protein